MVRVGKRGGIVSEWIVGEGRRGGKSRGGGWLGRSKDSGLCNR